jgi:hypothetical protein
MIPMMFMQDVIDTKDVSGINLPLSIVSVVNYWIWFSYAAIMRDPFMTVSQGLGLFFNCISLMFFYWATGKINAQDTPFFMFIQRQLLTFFSLFAV